MDSKMTKTNGLHWKYRTVDDLHEGESGYISFDGKKVELVRILKIVTAQNFVEVEILKGKRKGHVHQLFPDEVRLKEEDAKVNCVTL